MAETITTQTSENQLEQLIEQLSKMTVLQISQLTKALEDKWGVKAAAMAVAPQASVGQSASAEKAPEKTEFSVVLTNAGANKIQVIKIIREITNLGLKEAKDLVDSAPKPIKDAVAKDEAETIKKKIAEAGGTVEIA